MPVKYIIIDVSLQVNLTMPERNRASIISMKEGIT